MFFESLTISNWKGAVDVNINRIGKVMILVGPNGCGKSSTLEAFSFFSRAKFGSLKYNFQYFKKYNISMSCKLKDGNEISLNPDSKNIKFSPEDYGGVWLYIGATVEINNYSDLGAFLDDEDVELEFTMNKAKNILGIRGEIEYSKTRDNLFFGNDTFTIGELSDGLKKVLFSLIQLEILAEYFPEKKIGLIIDSPESHLHPLLLESYISRAFEIVFSEQRETGQLIIATQSPIVLSLFETEDIIRMESHEGRNQVKEPIPGRQKKLYFDLIGDELLKKIIYDFSAVNTESIFAEFIDQCLSSPSVVDTSKEGDAQRLQITSFLTSKIDQEIIILDFGAGSGRNMISIFQSFNRHQFKLKYVAYDPDKNNVEKCKKRIKKLKDFQIEIYHNISDIPRIKYDIILLSNVLHEIEIIDIISSLKRIKEVLKNDGYLVIQEHQLISGEPDFILFNEKELYQIFKTGGSSAEHSKSGIELLFYCIRGSNWTIEPNDKDILIALKMVRDRAIKKIIETRRYINSSNLQKKEIIRHAFYHSLLVNSILSIETIKKTHYL